MENSLEIIASYDLLKRGDDCSPNTIEVLQVAAVANCVTVGRLLKLVYQYVMKSLPKNDKLGDYDVIVISRVRQQCIRIPLSVSPTVKWAVYTRDILIGAISGLEFRIISYPVESKLQSRLLQGVDCGFIEVW